MLATSSPERKTDKPAKEQDQEFIKQQQALKAEIQQILKRNRIQNLFNQELDFLLDKKREDKETPLKIVRDILKNWENKFLNEWNVERLFEFRFWLNSESAYALLIDNPDIVAIFEMHEIDNFIAKIEMELKEQADPAEYLRKELSYFKDHYLKKYEHPLADTEYQKHLN